MADAVTHDVHPRNPPTRLAARNARDTARAHPRAHPRAPIDRPIAYLARVSLARGTPTDSTRRPLAPPARRRRRVHHRATNARLFSRLRARTSRRERRARRGRERESLRRESHHRSVRGVERSVELCGTTADSDPGRGGRRGVAREVGDSMIGDSMIGDSMSGDSMIGDSMRGVRVECACVRGCAKD